MEHSSSENGIKDLELTIAVHMCGVLTMLAVWCEILSRNVFPVVAVEPATHLTFQGSRSQPLFFLNASNTVSCIVKKSTISGKTRIFLKIVKNIFPRIRNNLFEQIKDTCLLSFLLLTPDSGSSPNL